MAVVVPESRARDKLKTYPIRWVVAHEPIDLSIRVARNFKEEMDRRLPGVLDIEILTLDQYAELYGEPGKLYTKRDLIPLMKENKVHISQIYSTTIGRLVTSSEEALLPATSKKETSNKFSDYWALDLPYLWRDHNHVKAVLEGDIGHSLLNGIKGMCVKPMAWCYSGGYRNIVGELGGEVRTFESTPIMKDTIEALGCKPVDGYGNYTLSNKEATYSQLKYQGEDSGTVQQTNHSLMLSSIVISKEFWRYIIKCECDFHVHTKEEELTCLRKQMKWACEAAAETERKELIAEEDEIKKLFTNKELPSDDLKKQTEWVYEKYEHKFSPGLLRNIKNTQVIDRNLTEGVRATPAGMDQSAVNRRPKKVARV